MNKKKIVNFFALIRYKNLLILSGTLWLIAWVWNPAYLVTNDFYFFLSAIVFTAAAGNIINDFFDTETDYFNKPDKQIVGVTYSRMQAFRLYSLCTLLAVVFAWKLHPNFARIVVVVTMALYAYSAKLKGVLGLGNVVVALLTALPIVLLGLFWNASFPPVLYGYFAFAFFTNIIREWVKDAEDAEGDARSGIRTLVHTMPAIGFIRFIQMAIFLLSIVLLVSFAYAMWLKQGHLFSQAYMVLCVLSIFIFPIRNSIQELRKVHNPTRYTSISRNLKIMMLIGMLSMIAWIK